MTTQQKEFRFAGVRCINADPSRYPQADGLANSFATALGQYEGVGYVLLRRRDVAALDPTSTFELEIKTVDESGQAGGGATTLKIAGLHIERAVKIGGGADGDDNAVFLVKIVDKRFLLNRWSSTVRQFNQRSWSGGNQTGGFDEKWIRETIKGPVTPWKVSEIVGQLWGDLGGIAGAVPAFPTDTYGRVKVDQIAPPDNLHFLGQNAWAAIHFVLHQVGLTTALGVDGKFEIVEFGGDQDLSSLNLTRVVYSAERWSGGTTFAPETIEVVFPTQYDDYGSELDTEPWSNFATTVSAYRYAVKVGGNGPVAGTKLVLWDTLRAIRRHGSWQIDNLADVQNRAVEIATAWLLNHVQIPAGAPSGWRSSGDRAHGVFSGVVPARLGPMVKAIIWRDYGRDPNAGNGDGLVTELIRFPGYAKPARFFEPGSSTGEPRTFKGIGFEWDDRQAAEHVDGLDFGRPTFPNYPRLPNIVKVVGFRSDPKCCVNTPDDGESDKRWASPVDPYKRLFGGVVHRYDAAAGGLVALEACWVYFPNYSASGCFRVEPNFFYYARLSGQETSIINGRKLPLYVAVSQVRPLPSYQHSCAYAPDSYTQTEYGENQGACDVRHVQVDKAASLSLYRNTLATGCCVPSVTLSIKGSPYPCAVFWTDETTKTPKWTVSPRMKTAQFKAGIELGGDKDNPSFWLIPNGEQKWKTPVLPPEGSESHIYAQFVNGGCVQLAWGARGVTASAVLLRDVWVEDCEVNVTIYGGGCTIYPEDGHECYCYAVCDPITATATCDVTLGKDLCVVRTSRGIVTQLCEAVPGPSSSTVECNVKHCKPLDQCSPLKEKADGSQACCEDQATQGQ